MVCNDSMAIAFQATYNIALDGLTIPIVLSCVRLKVVNALHLGIPILWTRGTYFNSHWTFSLFVEWWTWQFSWSFKKSIVLRIW